MKLRHILAGAMIASAACASAQQTMSGYFLDNYNYRYQLNPAFGNEYGFVSFPVLGNMNIGFRGTANLSDFIQVKDGRTVLFTNPLVSNSFLNDLPSAPRLSTDLNLNILSVGFKAFGGYNAVSVNARMNAVMNVPKSFFELAKNGLSNRTYDIKDLSLDAMGYAEIGLNHSRDIKQVPGLRVGASVKFLLGIANMQARFNEANLQLREDNWIATTNADIYANFGGLQFETDMNDEGQPYVSGVNMDGEGSPGINGFGMTFDLGASYKWKDFNFSLAVLDLGWLSYNKTIHASTNGTKTFETNAFIFNANDDKDNPHSFDNEWDKMKDDLDKLYQLEDNGDIGTRNVTMGATLNVGVDYEFPYYRNLHFGLLSTSRFMENNTWSEVRISANVAPVKWFSADVNGVFGTYGAGFGWMINFYTKGINFFAGMDNTLGRLAKQGIPLNSNASFNVGLNFPF